MNEQRVREIAGKVLDVYDLKTKRGNRYTLNGRRVAGFNSIFACESIPAAKMSYKAFRELQEERGRGRAGSLEGVRARRNGG